MRKKIKINLPRNPKIAVALVVPLMFMLGLVQVVQGFIDTHNYRDGIVRIIKEQTGRDVNIKGTVSISLLPTPTIYIPGVELRDDNAETPGPAATVDMIRLSVPIMAVFSDRPAVTGITLEHPVLELARARDNLIHWEWLNASLLKALAGKQNGNRSLTVEINDGRILYRDKRNDQSMVIDNISALGVNKGGKLDMKTGFTAYGHDMRLVLHTLPDATQAEGLMVNLISADRLAANLKGSMDLSGDLPKIKGAFTFDAQDVMEWVKARADNSAPAPMPVVGDKEAPAPEALPLRITGDWAQEGLSIDLANAKLDGLHSTGAGKMALTWNDWKPTISADLQFADFDVTPWDRLVQTMMQIRRKAMEGTRSGDTQQANPLPTETQATVHMTADRLLLGPQIWPGARLSADLADGAVTINEFHVGLPGDASLTLFGIISQSATSGLRYEGSMESAGKSLREALTVFDPSASELPETGFGAFSARSNIFVSTEQVRLSEADVKISDLHLNGGMVAYFDARPRLEADVKLKDINFDYFRDVWRERAQKASQKDFFLKFDHSMNYGWLKKLQTNIDLKVNVDGFTFLERKGNNASFRIFVKQGEFGVYDIHFGYPDTSTEASFNFNVTGDQPYMNLVLNTDLLDTKYFSVDPNKPAEPAPAASADAGVWSTGLFDMSWMEGFGASLDISIGKLTHGGLVLDRLKMQAKLDHNLLAFQNLNFMYWQGRCSVLGSIFGGKVPGVSVSFTLYDAELHDILSRMVHRDNITGKVSISGTLTTSGVNPLSWVSQSDSKLVLAGRGVHVNGLSLQGVVDAVGVSRTAADVFNSVNLALVNGATDFSVDGNINVRGGLMRTPGITLKTGAITGNLTGEVRLVPWTMDLSTLFQFPAITSETIPTMTVQLSGPIETPALRTDTSSLEAYVAKRIISK